MIPRFLRGGVSVAMTQFVITSAEFCHNVRRSPPKALLALRKRDAYLKVHVRD
jgi:hypothetical protein